MRDVKGLLRIHQMEASTTKPDLHTGLAQCLPFTFLLLAPLFAHTHLTRILCLLKPREEYEAKILLSPFRKLVPVQFPTRRPVPNDQLIDFICRNMIFLNCTQFLFFLVWFGLLVEDISGRPSHRQQYHTTPIQPQATRSDDSAVPLQRCRLHAKLHTLLASSSAGC